MHIESRMSEKAWDIHKNAHRTFYDKLESIK